MNDPAYDAEVLENLRQTLLTGKAIAFVGAGASAGLYPLWSELIALLTDQVRSRGLAEDADTDFWLRIARIQPQQAIQGIKLALGEAEYAEALRCLFRPRIGPDGNRYTSVHEALLRLPFRGYVTTNYDHGLLEARMKVRPTVQSTGYATWKDRSAIHKWYTDEIFAQEPCPILFAHGSYERADTIILGIEDYQEAYADGPYFRLLQKLWGQCRLVLVGFGFSDSWLERAANEVISVTAPRERQSPQHIALVGLSATEEYSADMRRLFRDQYNASVCFYPVYTTPDGREDHTALLKLLISALDTQTSSPLDAHLSSSWTPSGGCPPQRWVHGSSNDERFIEPTGTIEKLNRWAADSSVRAITVTGFGGVGKTAVIGHWLQHCGGDRKRPYRGVFCWSFYNDARVSAFLTSLMQFIVTDLGLPMRREYPSQVQAVVSLLQDASPLLIVMDGLEVLQQCPGTTSYGVLLEDKLRQLLHAACTVKHRGLIVLTSRFPFADLTPYFGSSLRPLRLDSLRPTEGAALLERCNVGGTHEDRYAISIRLEGHPLALRIFSAALATQVHGDPTRLCRTVFDQEEIREDEPLERKLSHLLEFYASHLPYIYVTMLGIISLFQTPIDEKTIRRLAREIPNVSHARGGASTRGIREGLRKLYHEHIIFYQQGASGGDTYSCHPVLRDYFRRALLKKSASLASHVASLLTESPTSGQITDIEEAMPILTAIRLVIEASDFGRADELYRERLANGSFFKGYPAPHEGMQCALEFVASEERRWACRDRLGDKGLAFYLNEVGVFAAMAGESDLAQQLYVKCAKLTAVDQDGRNLSICLQNHADLLAHRGYLAESEEHALRAVRASRSVCDWEGFRNALVPYGYALLLQGSPRQALEALTRAEDYTHRLVIENALYSYRGIKLAEALVRLGRLDEAVELSSMNLHTCRRNGWFDNVARCHYILGRSATLDGREESARHELQSAENIMRLGKMFMDLPSVLIAFADLFRQRGDFPEAQRYTSEAIRLAAPRELRIAQAEALLRRSWLTLNEESVPKHERLSSSQPEESLLSARDDAEMAYTLAQHCGYVWAQRDALLIIARILAALGDNQQALAHKLDAELFTRRLT